MSKRISIVLMNLGGPDKAESVKPFLFNLFYDPAIIRLPKPFRYLIAKLISSRRENTAIEIYNKIGGKSPIVENTERQANLLSEILKETLSEYSFKIHVLMRYWHPRTDKIYDEINKFQPDEVILLPLYPQFSTTTSESSINDFEKNISGKFKIKKVCCFYENKNYINAQSELISKYIEKALKHFKSEEIRILFSAHGLPEKIIKSGDPYQHQVEQTVEKVLKQINSEIKDTVVCYQSRVGPMKWIGPSTDEEIIRAGKENKVVILVPIAFVSEHSETLVELDLEYGHLAKENGIREYIRVPTLSDDKSFINSLALICKEMIENDNNFYPAKRLCDKKFCGCINNSDFVI